MAKIGAPTKYNNETIDKVREYLENYEDEGDAIPMVAGLAVYLGVSRETIYAWAKDEDKKGFSDIISLLMTLQEKGLVNGGIKGEFNSVIAKLMLTKHDYSDKLETDNKLVMSQEEWLSNLK